MSKKIKNCFYQNLTFSKLLQAHERARVHKLDLGQVFRHLFLRIFINYSSFAGTVDINIKENL